MPDQQPTIEVLRASARGALNRLAKWRAILAGWQVGSKAKGEPACDAVRDHRQETLTLRAELSAVVAVLIARGIIAEADFLEALDVAANQCNEALEKRFPGVKTTEAGIELDRDLAKPWMSKFPK